MRKKRPPTERSGGERLLAKADPAARGVDPEKAGRIPPPGELEILTRRYQIPTACFSFPNEKGDTPLHVAAMWRHLDQVDAAFRQEGEALSPDDLLVGNKGGTTPWHEAAEHAALDALVEVFRESGAVFSLKYWLADDRRGRTVLDRAADSACLDQVFAPSLWKGRLGEMVQLWERVREEDRQQVDFERVSSEVALTSRPRWRPAAFRGAARPSIPLPEKEGHGRRW